MGFEDLYYMNMIVFTGNQYTNFNLYNALNELLCVQQDVDDQFCRTMMQQPSLNVVFAKLENRRIHTDLITNLSVILASGDLSDLCQEGEIIHMYKGRGYFLI